MNKPLLIIDSLALCHRAKHAMSTDLSFEEARTEVIFNFMNQILSLGLRFKTNLFVFAWDSRKSKRADLYPDYKWKRKEDKTEEEIQFDNMAHEQFHRLRTEILPSLGFKNSFIQTGLEADDIIASICEEEYENYEEIFMVSRDHDLYQLLDYAAMFDFQTKKMMTVETFRDEWNTEPYMWGLKVKPIAGCRTDNVAGIVGVAEKTAIKYLNGDLTKGKKYDSILSEEGQAIIKRNKPLVCLPFKGTKKFTIKKERLHSKDFHDTFERLGFDSFLSQDAFREWEEVFCI